ARRAAYDRLLAARPAVAVSETDGAWEPAVEESWADLADNRPLRPTRPLEGWWAMLPPATLLAAVGAMFGAFVFSAPSLLALAGGLMVLALGLFVLAPLRAMSRRDDG